MLEHDALPQVLLFHGPKGVGKRHFAEELAHFLLSTPGEHPDLHHFRPEGKNDAHTMAGVRELIFEVSLPPYQASSKVFLIHQAERLTENCQNALLKTFEEPPANTYFILLCEELGALLPTLLSRACLMRFSTLPKTTIAEYLSKHRHASPEEAEKIASFCHGSLGKALESLEKKENKAVLLLRKLLSERLLYGLPGWHDLLMEIDALPDEEKHEDTLFEELLLWFRDLHLVKGQKDKEFLYHQGATESLADQAGYLNLAPLAEIYDIVASARHSLESHIRLRHILEAVLLKLTG